MRSDTSVPHVCPVHGRYYHYFDNVSPPPAGSPGAYKLRRGDVFAQSWQLWFARGALGFWGRVYLDFAYSRLGGFGWML